MSLCCAGHPGRDRGGGIRSRPWALLEDWFERIRGDYLRHGLGMLFAGILIYVLERRFGHYYVEGVGYATIQAILLGHLSFAWLMALLFICKLLATTVSLGSGSSGGIFSPSLFMGAATGGAFAATLHALHLPIDVSVPAFAMVGMGAMVGAGTGAAMTAVTMIFEMTRDYSIVLPMILAVAMALGVRRMLSRENIYTLKLARRGQSVPKALHTNMFLVRRAEEVMTKDALILPAATTFNDFLTQTGHDGRMRHVIVTRGSRIVGVLRVNTRWWRGLGNARRGITLGELAQPDFTVVRYDDVVLDVIQRMLRRGAIMALVIEGHGAPTPDNISGVIDKEHIAEAVAASVQVYPA
jgi:chloride channel protein, CIC family